MTRIGKEPSSSEITPEALYLRRREFVRNAALFTATSAGVGSSLLWLMRGGRAGRKRKLATSAPEIAAGVGAPELAIARRESDAGDEAPTPYGDVTGYNNFYEFGTDKSDPAENAHTLRPRPWTVTIEGEVR